ncbi:copper resistance CopC/CopD family protein [Planosporangium sp. 12N6]|uniref:copper resistance CopC/CopD family protein n=1 Tax=Planosporangium spinosum TaxID=3402278 RepID=UPI003CEF33D1
MTRCRALAALAGLLVGLFAVLVAPAAPASAHAALLQSEPQAGTVLATSPSEVVLTFSEPVRIVPQKNHIIGPDGRRVERGEPSTEGTRLRIPMKQTTDRGSYLISYRVISADSHPISGSIPFSIGAPSANAPIEITTETPSDPLVTTSLAGARYVGYAGLAMVTGPALFLALLWPRRLSRRGPLRLVKIGVGLVTVSSLAEQYLQAPYHAGTGVFGASAADLEAVFNSQYGAAHLVRIGVIAALMVLLPLFVNRPAGVEGRTAWTDRALVGILAVVGLATWPVSGHPAASSVPVLTTVADAAHLGAMAVWIGGLIILFGFLLRRANARELAAILPVWSRWAMTAVTVLVVAGTAQALVSLGSLRGLYGTTYGRLLLAKVGLLAVVLVVAAYSRRLSLRPTTAGAGDADDEAADGEAADGEAADGETADELTADARVATVAAVGSTEGAGRRAVVRVVPSVDDAADGADDGEGRADRADGEQADDGTAGELADEGDDEPDEGGRSEDDAGGDQWTRRRLRRSVLLELVGTVAVLVLTSVLVQTTPARATLEQADSRADSEYTATLTTKLYSLQVQLEPKRTGPNTIHLYAYSPDGSPIQVKEWKATAELPAQGIEPADVAVLPIADNHALAQALFSTPGTWQLRITLRTTDIDAATVVADVPIR